MTKKMIAKIMKNAEELRGNRKFLKREDVFSIARTFGLDVEAQLNAAQTRVIPGTLLVGGEKIA